MCGQTLLFMVIANCTINRYRISFLNVCTVLALYWHREIQQSTSWVNHTHPTTTRVTWIISAQTYTLNTFIIQTRQNVNNAVQISVTETLRMLYVPSHFHKFLVSSRLFSSHLVAPMWKVVATSALLPPWRLLSRLCSDQLLVTVPFLSLHRGHGTAYHLPSELFHPSPPFGSNWRHICLGLVLANFLYPPHCYYDCKVPLHRSRDSVT